MYSPDQFGTLSLLTSIAALAAPIFLLGMDQAVVNPKDEQVARRMTHLGLISLIGMSVLTGLGYMLFERFAHFEMENGLNALFLAAGVFVTGATYLLNQLVVRDEKYLALGIRNTIQSLSITGCQLGMAFIGGFWSHNGLILGFIIGTFVGILALLPDTGRYLRPVWRDMSGILRREWRYPLVFGPTATLAQLSQQFPLVFFAAWFGVETAGHVGMAERLIAIPTALIAMAGSSVFVGQLAAAVRENSNNSLALYKSFAVRLGAIGFLAFMACALLGPWIVPIFLGPEWAEAAKLLAIMSIVAWGRMMSTPLKGTFRVLGAARIIGLFEIFRTLILAIVAMIIAGFSIPLIPSAILVYGTVAAQEFVLVWLGYVLVKRTSTMDSLDSSS